MTDRPRVQYYAAQTLDGFIADPDDGLGWLMGYEGAYAGEGPTEPGPMSPGGAYERFYEGVGALVSGSATYEFVLAHEGATQWPYPGKPYRVLSSRDLPLPEGADVRVGAADDVAGLHVELVEAAGGSNVWIVGGGGVASQFAEAGLLDEVLVTVVPVVLGEGKPLFDRALSRDPMRLTGTTVFENGMVELRYELG
jgi:dihydrofolate reductase